MTRLPMALLALTAATPAASQQPPLVANTKPLVANTAPLVAKAPVAAPIKDPAPAEVAAGRKIVRLVLPPDKRDAMLNAVMTSMMGAMLNGTFKSDPEMQKAFTEVPEVKPVFAAFFDKLRTNVMGDLKANMPGLLEAYARAYARQFTIPEMTTIEAFLASPTGAKFAERGGTILTDPDVRSWQIDQVARLRASQQGLLADFKAQILEIVTTHAKAKRNGA